MAETERLKALGATEPRFARDLVSQPVVNAWLDAIEDADPRWTQGEAPPAMAQVWTMPGLRGTRGADDPLSGAMEMLDAAGYTSVLGTNCDQTYERYLRVGEQVSVTTQLEDVVGPKKTGVGEGYFVTTRNVWRVGDEVVASMQFRVLKFRPGRRDRVPEEGEERARLEGPDRSKIIRPVRNRDTDFFWEGTKQRELRIQKCNACGLLRHPPGPVCPSCHAMDRGYVVSSGRGSIFSFLVHHAPQMPGRELPVTIALVELDEGVRFVADVRGNPGQDSGDLAIGDQVVVGWDEVDDELTLPIWDLDVDSARSKDSARSAKK